jgi:hypothetical protein
MTATVLDEPDILLGPGDTAPVYTQRLTWASGDPINLNSATGFIRVQLRSRKEAFFDIPMAPVAQPLPNDPNLGLITIDFSGHTSNFEAGENYDYRFILQLAGGRQASVPDGRLPDTGREFYLLRVAEDFVVVP